jgi:HD-GYP domain-containing protein (c-di-GMP phosphodiesterase class II)
MINMIDLKVFDDYTFYHSLNVAIISVVIGTALKLPKKELYNLKRNSKVLIRKIL